MTVSAAPACRRDPRAERSRAALREAMIALLNEMPLGAVTAVALTERAGIGYATFARQYAGIDALLAEIARELIVALAARASPGATADQTADIVIAFVEEHRAVMRALLVSASAAVQREVLTAALTSARTASARCDMEVPFELMVAHATGAMLTVLTWWLRDAADEPPKSVKAMLLRLALRPIEAGYSGRPKTSSHWRSSTGVTAIAG